ncbi:MAG: imidazole glycerol phosphate synthase subunit HisH [Nanoarchaeota archaeon]
MIAIIDYGAGNLASVKNALDKLGVKSKITDKASDIMAADKVIFPGVGSFGDVMNALKERKLIDAIKKVIDSKPFLGICLGMQVLFEESEESAGVKGLSVFKGKVRRFKSKTLKIPQIGWNSINIKKKESVLDGVKDGSYFYFVHSYYIDPSDKDMILTTTDYGVEFVSSIAKDNVIGMQFHPERSGEIGLKILENFVKL